MGAKIKAVLVEIVRMAVTLVAVYAFAVFFLSLESHAPQSPSVNGKGSLLPQSPQSQTAALLFPIDYSASVRDCLPSGRACTEYRYYSKERAHGR